MSVRVILREAPATPGPSYRSSRSSRRGPAPAPPPRPIRRPAPQPPPRPAPPRPPPPGHGTLGTRQHSRNRSFGEELVTDHLFPTTEALVDVGLVGLHSGHVLDRQQLSLGTVRRGVSAVMVQYSSFRKARTGMARRASTQPDPPVLRVDRWVRRPVSRPCRSWGTPVCARARRSGGAWRRATAGRPAAGLAATATRCLKDSTSARCTTAPPRSAPVPCTNVGLRHGLLPRPRGSPCEGWAQRAQTPSPKPARPPSRRGATRASCGDR